MAPEQQISPAYATPVLTQELEKLRDIKGDEKAAALLAAFYGTPVPRDPDNPAAGMKSAGNGWRHGESHPFEYEGTTYDVADSMQQSLATFLRLAASIVMAAGRG